MKKNIRIEIIVLIVCILLSCFVWIVINKKPKDQLNEQTVKKLIYEDVKQKEIEKVLGTPITNQLFITGKESYIMESPNEDLIKKYKLESYVKKQKKYASHIQEAFKERFQFELLHSEDEGDVVYKDFQFITIYYGLYKEDLNSLVDIGVKMKNLDLTRIERSEKLQIEWYKIKVLAMQILDQNLDIYKNLNNEALEIKIPYNKNNKNNNDAFLTLLCNINGLTYKNADFTVPENKKLQEERLKKYEKELEKIKKKKSND